VEADGFRYLEADTQDGIHGCRRLLEDIGNSGAPQFTQLATAHPQDIFAAVQDFAGGVKGGRFVRQAGEGESRDALAAAAFAHQRNRGSFVNNKADTVYGPDRSLLGLKPRLEIPYFEQCWPVAGGHKGNIMQVRTDQASAACHSPPATCHRGDSSPPANRRCS
jgi:hypothetical protein